MDQNEIKRIQEVIGYNFQNISLLFQAFTRRSITEERGGENNEVLEFIGDKALDIAVVKMLCDRYGYFEGELLYDDELSLASMGHFCCKRSEGELTEIKKKLVEKNNLARCIEYLGFADKLYMSKGDSENEIYKKASVKEDLFEAIVGAVALDSKWNFSEIITVVDTMLNPDSIINGAHEKSYVELVRDWALKKIGSAPAYFLDDVSYRSDFLNGCMNQFDGITQQFDDLPFKEDAAYKCILSLGDTLPKFRGYGSSKKEARKVVCELAYKYLEEQGLLLSIKDEIDNPNVNDAISQLEILARRGYFSLPEYGFSQEYDGNGNPIWNCCCKINEKTESFSAVSSSKKEAKKNAAYNMLIYVIGDNS